MIPNIRVGDYLEMKKAHPCGGKRLLVLFTGSDIKVRCERCGREVVIARVKLEKSIKAVISESEHD